MKKLIAALTIGLVLSGCASTEPEFTADKDVLFKPDLKNHSIAYNIAMSAGAPKILRDVDMPEKAWNPTTTGSHLVSGGLGAMVGGLGFGVSELFRSVMGNEANGFDKPLLTMWIEVDSLKDYGSDEFEEMVYNKAHKAFFDAYVGDDEIIAEGNKSHAYLRSWAHKGDRCNKLIQTSLLPEKVKESIASCASTSKVRIIRPVNKLSWIPKALNLDNNKEYVLINFVGSFPSYNIVYPSYAFDNAMLYVPAKWTYNCKIDGQSTYFHFGEGFPYYRFKDKVYLFVTPRDGNQRGTFDAKLLTTK